jgi:hypothetical protein
LFKDEAGNVYTNIKSPLVINTKTLKGLQKVLILVAPKQNVVESSLTIIETLPAVGFNREA